jgi:flagellar hook assembly protein FlgD
VLASDLHGKQGESEKHRIVVYSTVAVSEKERNYSALQVQPNPFGDEVHFILKLEKHSEVSLKIYDLKGSLLHEEAPREHPSGEVDMHWDGTSGGQQLMTGTYLCRILVHDKDGELIHQEVLVKN